MATHSSVDVYTLDKDGNKVRTVVKMEPGRGDGLLQERP